MDIEARRTRRDFLVAAGTVGAGLLLTGCSGIAATAQEKKAPEGEEGVTATEDLMREHGVLERVLLIYEEAIRRLDAHEELLAEPLSDAAWIVRAIRRGLPREAGRVGCLPPPRKGRQAGAADGDPPRAA